MAPNPKLEILRSQLSGSIDSFSKKRTQNKKKAFRVYLGATAISATVTILLGLQGVPDNRVVFVRNSALILSAIVTLLTGFDTFFNHRALWVRYTQTVTQLFRVQAKLDYLTAGEGKELPEADIDSLCEEMQQVLAETNKWWLDQRAEASSGPKPPKPAGGVLRR